MTRLADLRNFLTNLRAPVSAPVFTPPLAEDVSDISAMARLVPLWGDTDC